MINHSPYSINNIFVLNKVLHKKNFQRFRNKIVYVTKTLPIKFFNAAVTEVTEKVMTVLLKKVVNDDFLKKIKNISYHKTRKVVHGIAYPKSPSPQNPFLRGVNNVLERENQYYEKIMDSSVEGLFSASQTNKVNTMMWLTEEGLRYMREPEVSSQDGSDQEETIMKSFAENQGFINNAVTKVTEKLFKVLLKKVANNYSEHIKAITMEKAKSIIECRGFAYHFTDSPIVNAVIRVLTKKNPYVENMIQASIDGVKKGVFADIPGTLGYSVRQGWDYVDGGKKVQEIVSAGKQALNTITKEDALGRLKRSGVEVIVLSGRICFEGLPVLL